MTRQSTPRWRRRRQQSFPSDCDTKRAESNQNRFASTSSASGCSCTVSAIVTMAPSCRLFVRTTVFRSSSVLLTSLSLHRCSKHTDKLAQKEKVSYTKLTSPFHSRLVSSAEITPARHFATSNLTLIAYLPRTASLRVPPTASPLADSFILLLFLLRYGSA